MPIQYRGIPAFLHLKKILASGLLEDVNIAKRYPPIPTPKENTNLRITGGCQYSIEVSLHSYT